MVCQGFPGAGQPCEGAQGLWLLQVITPFRKLILCAENRKEMEDWISALKSVQKWEIHEVRWVGGCAGAPRRSRAPLAAGQERRPPVQPRTAGRAGAGREAEGTRGLGGSECQPGGPSRLMGKGCAPPRQATQFNMEHFSGMHNWYACSHARPTFCNVCREALPGVTSHGLSCEGQWWGPAGTGEGDPL